MLAAAIHQTSPTASGLTCGRTLSVSATPVADRARTAVAGPRGFDGAKKVQGIKRHVVVDTLGLMLLIAVTAAKMTIAIVGTARVKGVFAVEPRRWVVERTFAWMNRCRRLTRRYEQLSEVHEGMAMISQIALMLRRLDGQTEPMRGFSNRL